MFDNASSKKMLPHKWAYFQQDIIIHGFMEIHLRLRRHGLGKQNKK
jgi:hypothetical protein